MYRKSFMKMAAVLLAAACTVTAVPQAAFADELISNEPVLLADEFVTAEDEALVTEDEEVASGEEAAAFDEDDILNDGAVEAEAFDGNDAAAPETEEIADDLEPDRTGVAPKLQEADFANATTLQLDTEYTADPGSVASEMVCYFFTPKITGRYSIESTATSEKRLYIKDQLPSSRTTDADIILKESSTSNHADLIAGVKYYICVYEYTADYDEKTPVTFKFSLDKEAQGMDIVTVEPEETAAPEELKFKSNKIDKTTGKLFGQFRKGYYYDKDINSGMPRTVYHEHFYNFTVPKAGKLTLKANSKNRLLWRMRDKNDLSTSTLKFDFVWDVQTTGEQSHTVDVIPGTYYLNVSQGNESNYDEYEFSLELDPIIPGKGEELLIDRKLGGDNNNINNPREIKINQRYVTQRSHDGKTAADGYDYFEFELKQASPIYLSLSTTEIDHINSYYFYCYDKALEPYPWYSYGHHEGDGYTYKTTGKDEPPLDNVRFIGSDKHDNLVKVFPAGKYIFEVDIDGCPGTYHFMISTGKVTSKPVSSLKLDNKNNVIALGVGDNPAILTATVGPKTASDTTVSFDVNPEGIIEVSEKKHTDNGETELEIKAQKVGEATITVRTNGANSKNKSLEATCMVSVIPSTVCEQPIAVREKIDLSGATYFNTSEITNSDKFDVISEDPKVKGIGSVSKGMFTAKKSGKVSIIWRKKINSKTYVPQKKVTIDLKMPEYKKNLKNKDIKASETPVLKRETEIKPEDWLLDLDKAETIKPDFYELDASSIKKGLATIDENGKVTVLKPGTIKVTAFYGEDQKNASKMQFTIKSKVPMVKDAKVKPNAVKPNAKDKIVNIAVTGAPNNTVLTADAWRIRKVTVDDKGNITGISEEAPDSEKIVLNAGVKGNYLKATVAVAPGTEAQTVAVIATIDGVDYPGYLTIQ